MLLVCCFLLLFWLGKTESPFVICAQRRSASKRWRVGFVSPRERGSSRCGTGTSGCGDPLPIALLVLLLTLSEIRPVTHPSPGSGWMREMPSPGSFSAKVAASSPVRGWRGTADAGTRGDGGASFFWQNTGLYNRSPLCSPSCLLRGVRLFLAFLTALSVHTMSVGSNASSDIQA